MADSKPNGPERNKGFTLLEILVAIAIFAVVVTLVFGTFDGVFSSANHVNERSDLFEMGNACLDRFITDLRAIHVMPYPRYKPPDIDDEPELYRVEGEPLLMGDHTMAKLRFASLAHLPFNQDGRDGIAEIVYYVQENSEGGLSLHRADHLYPYPEFEPNANDPIVCEQLLGFELQFFNPIGEDSTEWNSESDDMEYGTPAAIAVKLTLGPEDQPMTFNARIALPAFRHKPTKR